MNNNIEWTNQHEALLKKITKQCDILSEIHRYASRYYERRNKIFGTPLIVIGAITTTSIFSQSEYEYMFYVSGSLSLLTTILSAVGDWLGYKTKMVKHRDASISYEEISLEVNEQITFHRENRRPIDEYMKYVRDTFIKLKKNSQPISIGIYDKFTNSFDHFIKKMKKLNGTDEITKKDVYVQTCEILGEWTDIKQLRELSSFVENERERDKRRATEWEKEEHDRESLLMYRRNKQIHSSEHSIPSSKHVVSITHLSSRFPLKSPSLDFQQREDDVALWDRQCDGKQFDNEVELTINEDSCENGFSGYGNGGQYRHDDRSSNSSKNILEREIPEREIPEREIPKREIPKREIPEREIPKREIPERKVISVPKKHKQLTSTRSPQEKTVSPVSAIKPEIKKKRLAKMTPVILATGSILANNKKTFPNKYKDRKSVV